MPDITTHFVVVLCTTPKEDVSAELARGLVEAELAACVNILPNVRSIYRWQGATHDESESLLVIKTQATRFEPLSEWIRKHHPYSEPEIIMLPITAGSPSYLAWIASLTGGTKAQ
jgi:periplasmic divalent cation tolerance protein